MNVKQLNKLLHTYLMEFEDDTHIANYHQQKHTRKLIECIRFQYWYDQNYHLMIEDLGRVYKVTLTTSTGTYYEEYELLNICIAYTYLKSKGVNLDILEFEDNLLNHALI